ncbi:MAG: hypothetical protein OEZ01_14105 [Candidatus Heimdallarchaeota archaeon]|nr:hypothetical protein [Candidatus Heimdallarchaeota archaeon]MDH5647140.1 hypothetical protein [Candidatus Heimdallarchaeota archaeon]
MKLTKLKYLSLDKSACTPVILKWVEEISQNNQLNQIVIIDQEIVEKILHTLNEEIYNLFQNTGGYIKKDKIINKINITLENQFDSKIKMSTFCL